MFNSRVINLKDKHKKILYLEIPLPKHLRGLCLFKKVIIVNKNLEGYSKQITIRHEIFHSVGKDEKFCQTNS